MQIAIFAKKATTKDGKKFYRYLTTLTNKNTGEALTAAVRFREEAGSPDPRKCPMNIRFDKKMANLSTREYKDEASGEPRTAYTLWVTSWEQGAEYVDTSLDEYE